MSGKKQTFVETILRRLNSSSWMVSDVSFHLLPFDTEGRILGSYPKGTTLPVLSVAGGTAIGPCTITALNYIKQKLTHRPVLFALLIDAEDTIPEPDKLKRTFEIYKGQRGTDDDFFVALTVILKLGEANGCREDLRRAFNDLEEIDVDRVTPPRRRSLMCSRKSS